MMYKAAVTTSPILVGVFHSSAFAIVHSWPFFAVSAFHGNPAALHNTKTHVSNTPESSMATNKEPPASAVRLPENKPTGIASTSPVFIYAS
jgi:hypothetical protein